ncbi:LuxR C-terminal-related transcriptional regulator [Streptomyces sp. 7N604]|uniref:LuxR C-terminal-related transcriptional regulator n=1 Tax=Streptomyces sp. 7N604 TaxID=3457415 RepID=UPI003FD4B041
MHQSTTDNELTRALDDGDVAVAVIGHEPLELDGVRAAQRLRGRAAVILLVDESASPESYLRAIQGGVRGVLPMEDAREQLAAAIRSVVSGASVIGMSLLRRVAELVDLPDKELSAHIISTLSARELQVFELVGLGLSNSEVAHALSISVMTVKSHMSSVSRKLTLRDRAQAIVMAHRSGIVGE